MQKQEITCGNCEAEFYIEHDQETVEYCPFCKESIDTSEEEDWYIDEDEDE